MSALSCLVGCHRFPLASVQQNPEDLGHQFHFPVSTQDGHLEGIHSVAPDEARHEGVCNAVVEVLRGA